MRSPETAPPRPDLAFLRRRALPARTVAPVAAAPAAPTASTSLDLGGAVMAPPAPRAVVPLRRLEPGKTEVLTPQRPVVTLDRLQSGIGTLVVEAAVSPSVGDLRLGAAVRLADGTTTVLQPFQGAPARSARPVVAGRTERFEQLVLDLRQVRSIDRVLVWALSASDAPLQWGGTLVVSTFGGSRAELPMDGPPGPGVVPLLTVYNDDGELVVRAEPREVHASPREACLAMGFDRVTWLDPRTPT